MGRVTGPTALAVLGLVLAGAQGCAGGQAAAEEARLARGAAVYAASCQSCHGDRQGAGAAGSAPVHNETGHTWHHPAAQLKDWIMNGKLTGAMPAFGDKLSEEDVDVVLAFLKTWWTPEQRRTQEDVSRRYQEALDRQKASEQGATP